MSRKSRGADAAFAQRARIVVTPTAVGPVAYHAPRGMSQREIRDWRRGMVKKVRRKG